MANDFMGPSQAMGQQLQGILQASAESAANKRANVAMQQLQLQQMAKETETYLKIAETLYPSDINASLDYFNRALAPMNRSVTLEQYDPARKLLKQAEEFQAAGDTAGFTITMQSADKLLTNTGNIAWANRMKANMQEKVAQQQAKAVTDALPQDPRLDWARQVDQAPNPEALAQLTGIPVEDLQGQKDQVTLARTIVQGYEKKQQIFANLFRQAPSAVAVAGQNLAKSLVDPEDLAMADVATLLAKPERTEEEESRLIAKGLTYGKPALQQALGIKSAVRDAEHVRHVVEDSQARLAAIAETEQSMQQATQQVSSLALTPEPAGSVPESEAKAHILRQGVLDAESKIYAEAQRPRLQTLSQTIEEADRQIAALKKSAAYAVPAQREAIATQVKEYEAMREVSLAQKRLLSDESEFAIALDQAKVDAMEDGKQKVSAQKGHDALVKLRDEDVAVVEKEKARLARREAIWRGKVPEADRKAEQERLLNAAHRHVDAVKGRLGLTGAVKDAASIYKDVNISELYDRVTKATKASAVDAQAEFAALPKDQQTTQSAARIAKKYTVAPDDVLAGIKDPNKPGVSVEVKMQDEASKEAAKDFVKSTRATYDQLKSAPILLRNIDEAKALIPQAKGFMGPGGETLMEAAKFLNARLNAQINVEGIKSAEELRTRIFFNIMENLKKMDAQPSELQQKLMMDALGKLGTDPNALVNVLDAYGDTIRDKVELFNKEIAGAEKKGTVFPYDPRIVVPERRSATGDLIIRTEEERAKLPAGTLYIGPDGKKRRKQ